MAPGEPRHRSSTLLCAAERKVLEAASRSAMWLKEWAGAVFFLLSACLPMPLLPQCFGAPLESAASLSIAIPAGEGMRCCNMFNSRTTRRYGAQHGTNRD